MVKEQEELIEECTSEEGKEESKGFAFGKKLYFKKRDFELEQRYLEGQELLDMRDYINKHIFLYRNYLPIFEVNPGDIYFADFPVGYGSEIHGRHPVVVLNKSGVKQPMMTVIPLTSKSCNKVSDYDLGVIKGLSKNNEHSIAVINQTRSIDKRRLVLETAIDNLQEKEKANLIKPGDEVLVLIVRVCRLPKDKMDKLRNKVKRFIGYNRLKSH